MLNDAIMLLSWGFAPCIPIAAIAAKHHPVAELLLGINESIFLAIGIRAYIVRKGLP